MKTEPASQERAIRLLSDPTTYGSSEPVDVIETHGAYVFLAGIHAYKIKRAVRYDYLDQSTLERRRALIEREFELNAPIAPDIYQAVLPLDSMGRLGGDGEPVEWVLRMQRFPASAELSSMAARAGIEDKLAEDIGQSVARFHTSCPVCADDGAALMREIVDELGRVLPGLESHLGTGARTYAAAVRRVLDANSALLSDRGTAGWVRRAHGDLHLKNFIVLDGIPRPIDALEFDERLGTCDILYDLAFLVMDMRHGGHDRAACLAMNSWLSTFNPPQEKGLAAFPLFLSIRAAIRAMVEAQAADVADQSATHRVEAGRYLVNAYDYLDTTAPILVALGGFSGSGKSTLARAVAHRLGAPPGAVIIRSDVIRKQQAGLPSGERLPPSAYTKAAGQSVYREMHTRARAALEAGRAVVLDAVHERPESRRAVEGLADETGVAFRSAWIHAPERVLLARVAARRSDVSDATVDVVRRQLARSGDIDWPRIVNDGSPAVGVEHLARYLGLPAA